MFIRFRFKSLVYSFLDKFEDKFVLYGKIEIKLKNLVLKEAGKKKIA